jgi:predicted RNA binding protein YcfA (HicA-like mRNA interferase family)
MPRLRRLSGRRVARLLERAGFQIARITGDHAQMRNDRSSRRAVVPLTTKPLPVGTLASILRQAGLSPEEFETLL